MITLRADNRVLTANSQYSYLVDNYASGTNAITIVNTEGFSADDLVLIEDWGSETAEIFRVGSINAITGVITLETTAGASATTKFAHPESTKIYVLPYDQIRFYWTAAAGDITDENPTYDTNNPLTGYTDLTPASWYTTYSDSVNSTGFGWFVYYNSITAVTSTNSNPIPYAGFSGNTVAQVFQDFDSMLNVNELSLISISEKFSWLNEGLALLKNKLNLNNVEYFVSSEQTLTIVAGTSEYQLPSDFSDLLYVHDGTTNKLPIDFINVKDAGTYNGTEVRYYLRNRYLGIVPTPATGTTYKYRYRSKAATVTSVSTYLDLPDNAFYALKDWMMYRASLKFNNPIANTYYQAFTNSVNHFVQASVKRESNQDSWEPAPYANV